MRYTKIQDFFFLTGGINKIGSSKEQSIIKYSFITYNKKYIMLYTKY